MTKTKERVPGFDLDLFQETELFRSSIDSVLLANWIQLKPQQKLVDLCSGSGLIGLCLAQKFQVPTVLLELQAALAQLAQETITYNHLQSHAKIIHTDIKQALHYVGHDSIDVITCNPPYFKAQHSPILGKSLSQNIARHELYFDLPLLGQIASALLKDNGLLYLVYRLDRFFELAQVLQTYHLPIKETLFIYPHQNASANLVLIKCRKTRRQSGYKVWPGLVLYTEDGHYSKQLRAFCS